MSNPKPIVNTLSSSMNGDAQICCCCFIFVNLFKRYGGKVFCLGRVVRPCSHALSLGRILVLTVINRMSCYALISLKESEVMSTLKQPLYIVIARLRTRPSNATMIRVSSSPSSCRQLSCAFAKLREYLDQRKCFVTLTMVANSPRLTR